ncbi:MAG: hypothetical protein ACK56I_29010, partial [bacterium]
MGGPEDGLSVDHAAHLAVVVRHCDFEDLGLGVQVVDALAHPVPFNELRHTHWARVLAAREPAGHARCVL